MNDPSVKTGAHGRQFLFLPIHVKGRGGKYGATADGKGASQEKRMIQFVFSSLMFSKETHNHIVRCGKL